MRQLKTRGAGVLDVDTEGWAAMHYAATHGRVEAVNQLRVWGALFDGRTKHGRTPLILAAEQGNQQICEVLRECHAMIAAVDSEGQTALTVARKRDHLELVEYLDEWVRISLKEAAEQGRTEVVKMFVPHDVPADSKLDEDEHTVLHLASGR